MSDWRVAGHQILRDFLPAAKRARLREACDHVLAQLVTDARQADAANIAFLTQRRYFESDLTPLIDMLEMIAAPAMLRLLEPLGPPPFWFFNTQYFHEQRTRDWDGLWHRDTQFEARDPEVERRRIESTDAVHLRVAFEPDDRLELVPGSQSRWDTPEEQAIRRGGDPSRADMPGRLRIELEPGDACLFHAWMIHRGTYRIRPRRRTFDILYGFGPPIDFGQSAPPNIFRDPEIRERLSPEALAFFDESFER